MTRLTLAVLLAGLNAAGCTHYQYAKNVKMVSLDGNVAEGRGIGPVRGESCQASVMGRPIGEQASLDGAIADARQKNQIRYLNNVSTEDGGFDAFFYARHCMIVKGTGYQ
jgi:hypothetical protein